MATNNTITTNTLDTVNAAATAIITAETRLQPSSLQKRRWISYLSLYWCFGSCKNSKRIGHAVLVPEVPVSNTIVPSSETSNRSSTTTTTATTTMFPFIAPPSSPASFLQSDPPSGIQTPAGLPSLTSLSVHAYSSNEKASTFIVGPYAHETQLVTPPVFSAGTTEPSTAAYTPPPESVLPTTPSSPEVPFAQLLASSLARNGSNGKTSHKLCLSQYEFQPYQYPASPGSNFRSPSEVSNSGTSLFYPGKHPAREFNISEPSKFFGYDQFTTHKWGSRLGSGSLTPNGWGSRLGSGSVTPSGGISRGGSGTLTPNGGREPVSQDIYLLESQIYEDVSVASSDNITLSQDLVDHRVSFELIHEESQIIPAEQLDASNSSSSEFHSDRETQATTSQDSMATTGSEVSCESCTAKSTNGIPSDSNEESVNCSHKRRTITLGSIKEFNFDNTKEEVPDKSTIECQWWKNEKIVGSNIDTDNEWTFFPTLRPGVS